MNKDIQKRYLHMLEFTQKVEEFLLNIQSKKNFWIDKKGQTDLVTEADIGSEAMLTKEIREQFPEDSILGEEKGSYEGSGKYKWILDPLDGTTNFSHGLPLFGVSIGLENRETGKIDLGIVATPVFKETYHAVRGNGAFKNKKKILVSNKAQLIESLICTGFPYDLKDRIDSIIIKYKNMLLKSRGIRRTGTATLDLCWIAEGRFDGFWEENLKPWDMAGPSVIIEEAGGTITDFLGNTFNPYVPNVIASNGFLHQEIIEIISSC